MALVRIKPLNFRGAFSLLILFYGFSACNQETTDTQPALSRQQAELRLKEVERLNRQEVETAKKSGDSKKLQDAKIASTKRLAKAQRALDEALVAETKQLVKSKAKKQ